ncbi:hypothetical protein ACH9L7_01805 [Haloferax sp. S1W]|uniref:hypothetical protein n=1 Tax=Haloferax sp. S1W TaxID=3377110 RepID=UPI0037C926A2
MGTAMIPDIADAWLLSAYVSLFVFSLVQYYRDKVPFQRAILLCSMCLTWISYELIQVAQDGLIPDGTPLNYAVEGLGIAVLVAGLYGLYWSWRHRDETREPSVAHSGESS